MSERVVGYIRIEKEVIISRPCTDAGEALKPITAKRILFRPIMEDLGPRTFTTVDAPELPRFQVIPWVNPKVNHEE
ncbi:hypothetical protein HYU45_03185 [Candidatus Daviesbacteria bacterium]|nr:hypothetical protein [Candidatus Daviesbacteria bacterium]